MLLTVSLSVLVGVVLTALFIFLVVNLTPGHEKKITTPLKHLYKVTDPAFARVTANLLGPNILGGNKITTLINGDQIFAAMLEAIRGAQRTICFETYIYWSGEIGRRFAEALAERARAGVRVHVVLDGVGCQRLDDELLQLMMNAGAEVERYHPLRLYNLNRFNNRTHRKLLIIDGRIGFTGGVGIADPWRGNAQDAEHWRDTHFRVEGPVVAQMQGVFMDNWLKTSARPLHGEDYFPALPEVGGTSAHMFRGSANEGNESMRLLYLLAIASAERSVRIASAYFVPDDLCVKMLVDARARGVEVQIIVPGPIIDFHVVRRASRARWGPLLEAGVEIYEYQRTMFHVKVMIVDEHWVTIGSTNFDNRSFRLNDEANLNIFDRDLAREQVRIFESDRRAAQRISYATWKQRPVKEKVQERAAVLLRSQL